MKILIIKLGAMGDVLRTTPLLTGLKRRYPECRITWLVDSKSFEVLEGNPLIETLWVCSKDTLRRLGEENFDLAVNLDKEEEALEAILRVGADKKIGFGRLADGRLCALDPPSDYACRLGIDDELKFRKNKKTYQEICFEQAGLHFGKQEYLLNLDEPSVRHAKKILKRLDVDIDFHDKTIIGLNTGSGARFAGKKLSIQTHVELAKRFHRDMDATVLLLGGQGEIERNKEIQSLCKFPVVNTGSHPVKLFAAIVRECDLVVSGDTIAMHIAIAMKVPVVAFFASTCAAEIELYGRGKKIVSSISCAPCYKKICPIDEQCMKDMSVDEIFEASKAVLEGAAV